MTKDLEKIVQPLIESLSKKDLSPNYEFLKESILKIKDLYQELSLNKQVTYLQGIIDGLTIQENIYFQLPNNSNHYKKNPIKQNLKNVKSHQLEYLSGISFSSELSRTFNLKPKPSQKKHISNYQDSQQPLKRKPKHKPNQHQNLPLEVILLNELISLNPGKISKKAIENFNIIHSNGKQYLPHDNFCLMILSGCPNLTIPPRTTL
jgi:hypothetical protein